VRPRDGLFVAVALLTLGLAGPSAARTPRHHLTYARFVHHRRHRVAIIRSGNVTASYVPASRVAEPPRANVASAVRAVPAGYATECPETRALWSTAGESVQPGRVVRTASSVRPAGPGARIPEDRFNVLFGEERPFRLSMMPTRIVGSHVQFENGGYWFTLLDAVPRSWPDTWYDTDAISIVEKNGGYALFDASYPTEFLSLRAAVAEQ